MDFVFIVLNLLFLNLCIYYFKFMYWIYVFINYLNCFMIFEFMYLFNSCIYYFLIYVLIIKLFFMFLFIIISRHVFYDLMIFIYNPKELKLSSRKQYK